VNPMLLPASSDASATAVVRALSAADIEAEGATRAAGIYAVSVKVPSQRDAAALDIATTIDPSIREPWVHGPRRTREDVRRRGWEPFQYGLHRDGCTDDPRTYRY
jgi:hypothetical protein